MSIDRFLRRDEVGYVYLAIASGLGFYGFSNGPGIGFYFAEASEDILNILTFKTHATNCS